MPAHGALAQLGEQLLCKHQVIGSIPIGSTNRTTIQFDEDTRSGHLPGPRFLEPPFIFDIVNGFFKSMPWRHAVFGFRLGDCLPALLAAPMGRRFASVSWVLRKAEIIIHTKRLRFAALPSFGREIDPALSLVVWTLKREVRATGGCLGMYRR